MKKREGAQKFLVSVILFLITSTSISISAFASDFKGQHSNTNEALINRIRGGNRTGFLINTRFWTKMKN